MQNQIKVWGDIPVLFASLRANSRATGGENSFSSSLICLRTWAVGERTILPTYDRPPGGWIANLSVGGERVCVNLFTLSMGDALAWMRIARICPHNGDGRKSRFFARASPFGANLSK